MRSGEKKLIEENSGGTLTNDGATCLGKSQRLTSEGRGGGKKIPNHYAHMAVVRRRRERVLDKEGGVRRRRIYVSIPPAEAPVFLCRGFMEGGNVRGLLVMVIRTFALKGEVVKD